MLHSINTLKGFDVRATDGACGDVHDFFFDDIMWVVRYLVVDTGGWLSREKVILPREVLGVPDRNAKQLPVDRTKKEIEGSPPVDADKPVSRVMEAELAKYFALQHPYWAGGYLVGGTPADAPRMSGPGLDEKLRSGAPPDPGGLSDELKRVSAGESHLRSVREVSGYHIHADDEEEFGRVSDFIVGEEDWIIRYLVVDTRTILSGRKTLMAVPWIRKISWSMGKVYVDLTTEEIKAGPEYDPDAGIDRKYEEILYHYYDRPRYWIGAEERSKSK